MKKLIIECYQEKYLFEFDVGDNKNLKLYFIEIFKKELEELAKAYNEKDKEKQELLESNLLSTKIFKENQVTPWWSQGNLQECFFSQDSKGILTVSMPDFDVYELNDWFEENKINLIRKES